MTMVAPLGVSCLLGAVFATSTTFVLAAAAAAVRVLPWLLAPDIPLALTGPFVRALVATVLEVAVLVGVPVGCAIGAVRFVARGEARALFAIGVAPGRLVRQLVIPAGAIGLAAWMFQTPGESPGRFAERLIDAGRASCLQAETPRVVEVPLLGMTWLCPSEGLPRLAGRVPGVSSPVWFTAHRFTPSDDLTTLELTGLRLSTPALRTGPRLQLTVEHARLTNLASWGSPPNLDPPLRAGLVASSAILAALLLTWQVLRRSVDNYVLGGAFAAATALALLALLKALDRASAAALAYMGVAALSAGLPLAFGVILSVLQAKTRAWRGRPPR